MNLEDFLIHKNDSIHMALKKIDANEKGFLIVTDETGILEGTLTDGDIRRGLLCLQDGTPFSKGLVQDYYRSPCTSILVTTDFGKIINIFKKKSIKFIPIVDEEKKVVNIVTKANMHGILLQNIKTDLSYDFINMDETMMEYEIYERPWGFYKTTILNDFYQSKVIEVKPMQTLSLQKHLRREEHWIVVNGTGTVQMDESILPVQGGSSIYIPKGCKHRIQNTSSKENLIFIEVQRGDYFGEDDIIRFEDEYGRI